jgi:hypothetical protein
MSYGTDVPCRLFVRRRQAYYERLRYVATTSVEEATILSPVREVRKDFPRTGARKVLIYLRPQFDALHLHIGWDAFIELPYRDFMLVRKVKNRRKATFSNHRMHKYPNLAAGYAPTAPNRLWVSDITYIATGSKIGYLSLITDAYSHKIVGWDLVPDTAFIGGAGRIENGAGDSEREASGAYPPFRPWQPVLLSDLCQPAYSQKHPNQHDGKWRSA